MLLEELLYESDPMDNTEERLQYGVNQILTQCEPYLQQIGMLKASSEKEVSNVLNNKVLLRGIKGGRRYYERKSVRTDRKPTDTPQDAHKVINQWFVDKFGAPIRSEGLFAATTPDQASGFGTQHYMFPEGDNYKMIASSKVFDLYEYISEQFRQTFGQSFGPFFRTYNEDGEVYQKALATVKQIMDQADYQYYDPMTVKQQARGEVIVLTNYYHVVPHNMHLYLSEMFSEQLQDKQ